MSFVAHGGHGHHHGNSEPASPRVRRALLIAVAPFLVATITGLVILWPSSSTVSLPTSGQQFERFSATVVEVTTGDCPDLPGQEDFTCSVAEARLEEGPDQGETVSLDIAEGPNARHVKEGDPILVGRSEGEDGPSYFFADFERGSALLLLAALFAITVVALSRLSGLAALGGMVISLALLIRFVLPSILEGNSPVWVALVGGAAIMFVALYLAHGFNARTTTAMLGTLASLAITGLLAMIFVEATRFTGFGSEEAVFLQVSAQQVNLQGLLLGGIIIGTLGVLDDVTVTQASSVWELHEANPDLGTAGLYRAALRIGRDHIASTVNTLVLAYVGASLPLLLLFTLSNRPLGDVLTSEVVAEEIVRTLVGSIGLVAAVPITTALASVVARSDRSPAPPNDGPVEGPPERDQKTTDTGGPEEPSFKPPRAERFWRT